MEIHRAPFGRHFFEASPGVVNQSRVDVRLHQRQSSVCLWAELRRPVFQVCSCGCTQNVILEMKYQYFILPTTQLPRFSLVGIVVTLDSKLLLALHQFGDVLIGRGDPMFNINLGFRFYSENSADVRIQSSNKNQYSAAYVLMCDMMFTSKPSPSCPLGGAGLSKHSVRLSLGHSSQQSTFLLHETIICGH